MTYSNRNKSVKPQSKNKVKKRFYLLGEHVSPIKKSNMENSLNNVSNWLDQNNKKVPKSHPRQPFADLNVNHCNLQTQSTPVKSVIDDKLLEKTKSTTKLNRKLFNFRSTQSIIIDSQSESSESFGWTPKKLKKEFSQYDRESKYENDVSDIVAIDEPIVIDDSQSQIVDKDRQAWLAVVNAEKNHPCTPVPSIRLERSENIKYTDEIERITTESITNPTNKAVTINKVPFFKKSCLIETCKLCIDHNKRVPESAGHTKDVKITIENNSFTTTIHVTTLKDRPKVLEKKSTSVQTEHEGVAESHEVKLDVENKYKRELDKFVILSQDLFTVEKNSEENTNLINGKHMEGNADLNNAKVDKSTNASKQIIIADSDSEDANESSLIHIVAEVHRSSDEM